MVFRNYFLKSSIVEASSILTIFSSGAPKLIVRRSPSLIAVSKNNCFLVHGGSVEDACALELALPNIELCRAHAQAMVALVEAVSTVILFSPAHIQAHGHGHSFEQSRQERRVVGATESILPGSQARREAP